MLKAQPDLRVIGEASDGLEAIQKAQTLKPDLVLLDIGLPQLNGLEVENQLCQLVPSARVLFVSQDSDAEIVHAALNNGAQGYVLKADAGELLPAITAVIRGERFVSSGIKLARP
jgi:DNA-binding NarL/FixJ family response regulator